MKTSYEGRLVMTVAMLLCGAFAALCHAGSDGVADTGTQLSKTIYTDPKGFFTIRPPEEWIINEYKNDPRGKVDFNTPGGGPKAQLKLIGMANPFSTFDALLADCEGSTMRMKSRMGGAFETKTISMFGTKAVEILVALPSGIKQRHIQFLVGSNYYSFVYGAPSGLYAKHYDAAMKSLQSFESVSREMTDAEKKVHVVASKLRLAKLYLSIGQKEWAATSITEGLSLDPNNEELLRLKKEATTP